jgi:hypothetical protein
VVGRVILLLEMLAIVDVMLGDRLSPGVCHFNRSVMDISNRSILIRCGITHCGRKVDSGKFFVYMIICWCGRHMLNRCLWLLVLVEAY